MAPELPSFFRRRLRLHEARRALLSGAPEQALEHLADRCLSLSTDADRLRERVLDVLCREAARANAEGQRDAAAQVLDRVALHDPPRAEQWRRRLSQEAASAASRDERSAGRMSRAGESRLLERLEDLLGEMRHRGVKRASRPASVDSVDSVERRAATAPAATGEVAPPSSAVRRFQLAVDDAGEFLVVSGEELFLGHARNESVDLPFLADLDGRHARLSRRESFHGGPRWWIEPARGQALRVAGRALSPDGATLADGDLVELSSNLALRFLAPEPSSGSAVLELLHGVECEGAQRVLLLAPGPAGRTRFGVRARRAVQLRGADLEVVLERAGGELVVGSPSGLRAIGPGLGPDAGELAGPELRVPCPPPARIDFTVGAPLAGRPPFGFSIAPVRRASSRDGTLG